MQDFTQLRGEDTPDEIWWVEHPPVFTLGLNGKTEHLLNPTDIPVVQIDRGGQVTYHGPGQLVLYLLLDLRRRHLGIRQLVETMELAVIELLAGFNITATGRRDAPWVYTERGKIAAVGLRIKHGCTYHGLALNIDMDLEPFLRINPCGYAGMQVTQLSDFTPPPAMQGLALQLARRLMRHLGDTEIES